MNVYDANCTHRAVIPSPMAVTNTPSASPTSPVRALWIHRFAWFTAAMTFVLIFVGGLVKSHEAGLSVPDWPTSFGYNMFALPFRMWMDNTAFYEHGHRLYATVVGFLIMVQAFLLQWKEPRTWVKRLGWLALALVIIQGILGGLTVIYYLPTWISTSHAGLAQSLFCLTLGLAVVTSPRWKDDIQKRPDLSKRSLFQFAALSSVAVFIQLILGAIMRHEEAGLAIPDFPLAFGGLIPPFDSFGITIHFAHRVSAVIVTTVVIMTARQAMKYGKEFRSIAQFAIGMVLLQFTLGALTVWTGKAITPTTLHVSGGAALLGIMVFLSIKAKHLLAHAPSVERETDVVVRAAKA